MDCPKISIIILNWNNWKDTIECISSVRHINYPNYNITLVDNGSTNDSVNQIKQHFHSEKNFNFFDVPFFRRI